MQEGINQLTYDGNFKIKFGAHCLTVGPLTANNLVNTTPFSDVFSADNNNDNNNNMNQLTCDSKWDICTCKTCPVFRRLVEFEAVALKRFSHRQLTVLHSQDGKKIV